MRFLFFLRHPVVTIHLRERSQFASRSRTGVLCLFASERPWSVTTPTSQVLCWKRDLVTEFSRWDGSLFYRHLSCLLSLRSSGSVSLSFKPLYSMNRAHFTHICLHLPLVIHPWSYFRKYAVLETGWSFELKRTVTNKEHSILQLDCLSVKSWDLVGTSSNIGPISNPRTFLDYSVQTTRCMLIDFKPQNGFVWPVFAFFFLIFC